MAAFCARVPCLALPWELGLADPPPTHFVPTPSYQLLLEREYYRFQIHPV